jgi:hypothetical protein
VIVYAFRLIEKMMFSTTHEHEALTLYIHSMTASR